MGTPGPPDRAPLVEWERITAGPGPWTPLDTRSGHYAYLVEAGRIRMEIGGTVHEAGPEGLLWAGSGVLRRLHWGADDPATGWVVRIRNRTLGLTSDADLVALHALLRLGRLGERVGALPCRPATVAMLRARLVASPAPAGPMAQKALLFDLLDALLADPDLVRALEGLGGRRSPSAALVRAIQHMEAHAHEPLSVPGLARMAGLSRSQFHRRFREVMPATPHAYLRRLRVGRAARLLGETDRTVLDVSLACGFGSVSRLYDAFHRVLGRPPGQMRRPE